MSKQRKITTDDLLKVKRMGDTKAKKVMDFVDGFSKTADPKAIKPKELANEIDGVSETMATEIVALIKDPDGYQSQPPTPRKKAARKKATKVAATSNGHVSAGAIRRFAREAEALGFEKLATDLYGRVAPLLDSEKVSKQELNV